MKTVVCVGSVTPVGEPIRKLEPSGYYLTVDKTGRILEVRGLKPWDGRRMETIWLGQALLPEHPVEPGDTWTVNDVFFSRTTGGKTPENVLIDFWEPRAGGVMTPHIRLAMRSSGREWTTIKITLMSLPAPFIWLPGVW